MAARSMAQLLPVLALLLAAGAARAEEAGDSGSVYDYFLFVRFAICWLGRLRCRSWCLGWDGGERLPRGPREPDNFPALLK